MRSPSPETARRGARLRETRLECGSPRGSHIILTKPGNIATLSVPNHAQVARGTLRSLIARSGTTVEEFLKAL